MQKKVVDPISDWGGRLTAYLHEPDDLSIHRGARPGILIFPGGGYEKIVTRECDPVAFEFFSAGFNAFILEYSIRETGSDKELLGLIPLAQASAAIMYIRKMSKNWNMSDDLAVLGCSAGGHLAGSCGTMWNCQELYKMIGTCDGMNRPDAVVMCYPVVLSGEYAHKPSLDNLADETMQRFFDLTAHMGDHVPPTFLWTTQEDQLVPCENTLQYALALQKHHISYELHIYPYGEHGITLGTAETNIENVHIASWVKLCKEWLGMQFDFSVSV